MNLIEAIEFYKKLAQTEQNAECAANAKRLHSWLSELLEFKMHMRS